MTFWNSENLSNLKAHGLSWTVIEFCNRTLRVPTISGKILCEFQKACLKFPVSPYTMLLNHNIAWRKFSSLFLNIVKREKGIETQNCPNSSSSNNFCHWLSEKIWKIKASILQFLVLHQIEGMQLSITSQFCNVLPLLKQP